MPQALTSANMAQLQTYANQNTIAGVLNYYNLLESKGYSYATLAKGVVLDNTPSGSAARTFAENVGKITGTNTNITAAQWDTISIDPALCSGKVVV